LDQRGSKNSVQRFLEQNKTSLLIPKSFRLKRNKEKFSKTFRNKKEKRLVPNICRSKEEQ